MMRDGLEKEKEDNLSIFNLNQLMILKKAVIYNFRGIKSPITINFDLFNCIVGQNDAGKSTILKALDASLNDINLTKSDFNVDATENQISIDLFFDCQNQQLQLGEEISTTIENEELVDEEGHLVWRKVWTVTDTNISKAKISISRKKYAGNNDFIFKTETQLIDHCRENSIDTNKGNGEVYNNVEKRAKLRIYNAENNIEFSYIFEELPTSGSSKLKVFGDSIKNLLPTFQYFKADTSLSETDTTIQKYFKEIAFKIIKDEIDTDEMELTIKAYLESVLEKITSKINDVVKSTEKVKPKVDFDWSKLISTTFVSDSSGADIPLSSRGDGFRRITMMSYFEYLAESQRNTDEQQIIFGFEEPETFLHPSAQENLFDKLNSLAENNYQVIVSTHSPTIVGNSNLSTIIHISRPSNVYTVNQNSIDYKTLAIDLGIKPDNTFTPLFSTSRALFLVEGIDDVNAMNHNALKYKENGLIASTFNDLNINIIPIGGCGGVKHWVNLELFTKLGKPFFIFLDSDKDSISAISQNEADLIEYGLVLGEDFLVSKKRHLENYIPALALQALVPGSQITYSDFDHAKNFCKDYPDSLIRGQLGGKNVAEKYYGRLTFDNLRSSWYDGNEDEFLKIHSIISSKIN